MLPKTLTGVCGGLELTPTTLSRGSWLCQRSECFFLFCDEVWVYVCYVWGTGQVGASVMYTTRTLFTGQHRLDNRRCNFCQNSILISRKLRFVYLDYFVGGTWGFAINSIFRHQEGLIHLSGSTLVREIITCTDVSMYRSLISWMIDNISYYRVFSMRKA